MRMEDALMRELYARGELPERYGPNRERRYFSDPEYLANDSFSPSDVRWSLSGPVEEWEVNETLDYWDAKGRGDMDLTRTKNIGNGRGADAPEGFWERVRIAAGKGYEEFADRANTLSSRNSRDINPETGGYRREWPGPRAVEALEDLGPEFDDVGDLIEMHTPGADWWVRFVSGSYADKDEKLRPARNFYGSDKVRMNENGRQEYWNKEFGRYFLVNPKGLDGGDFAEYGKDIISSAVGKLVEALSGPVFGKFTSNLASASAEEIVDAYCREEENGWSEQTDGESVPEKSIEDIAVDILMNTMFGQASDALKEQAKEAFRDILNSRGYLPKKPLSSGFKP